MFYFWTQHFANGPQIREVPVGGDLQWIYLDSEEGAAKEPLRGSHISGGAEHGVDQIASPINRAIQVGPLAFHLYIGFIHVPLAAHFPFTPATQPFGEQRRKARLPVPHLLRG
ncbi:MAG TPA: hypothetical protein VK638_20850 [Edaphobacter sp.]|nr:hypothetical protein [Edaphobacter sp.]